jgi:hypothetical protein
MPEKQISEYTNDRKLSSIMENAKKNNEKELWWKCLRRRCELKRQGLSAKGPPLDLEFYAVMLAYETVQAELRRRKQYRANRTWKMFENKGAKVVLEKWAKNRPKGSAFKVLFSRGRRCSSAKSS